MPAVLPAVLKVGLITGVICLLIPAVAAEQQGGAGGTGRGRSKPPAKSDTRSNGTEGSQSEKEAAELFEAGQTAHQSGDLEKAVELYGEALKRDQSLWQAEFQLGIACLSLSRYAEARKALLHVDEQLAQFDDSPELRQIYSRVEVALGEVALAESKTEEAEKAFRRALELNPQSARAHSGLGELLLAKGKQDEAIEEARAAIAAGDERAAAFSLVGIAQTLSGKYDEALPNLNEALKRDPKNGPALLYRAEVHLAKNRLNEAIADLRSAVAIDPQVRTKLRLAAAHSQIKQYAEAIALYQEILGTDPSNAEARTGLAAVMIESGRGSEAIAQLELLIKSEPNRADLHAQLGELYLTAQPEKALEQYSIAAKLEPSQPAHQIGSGSALVKLRRFQEAIDILKRALGQNLKEETAYFAHTNLGTALFELDDYPNAAHEFIWIFNYHKNRGDQRRAAITLYFLGICFDKLGDFEQALKAYEQFLSLASPENQLEVDKVKLRLPPLQRLIKEGKGKKK